MQRYEQKTSKIPLKWEFSQLVGIGGTKSYLQIMLAPFFLDARSKKQINFFLQIINFQQFAGQKTESEVLGQKHKAKTYFSSN